MICSLLAWLAASFAFVLGWAMRPITYRPLRASPRPPVPSPRSRSRCPVAEVDQRRIVRDWAEAHRVLDGLQVATEHEDLAPRVTILAKLFAAAAGLPVVPPSPDSERRRILEDRRKKKSPE